MKIPNALVQCLFQAIFGQTEKWLKLINVKKKNISFLENCRQFMLVGPINAVQFCVKKKKKERKKES